MNTHSCHLHLHTFTHTTHTQQLETMLKKKTLEVQLSEARLAQQAVASAQEKENSLAERQFLIAETLDQQKRFEVLSKQESDLRGQLSLYSDKFEEFQETLTKSNQAFASFKKEMDKASGTVALCVCRSLASLLCHSVLLAAILCEVLLLCLFLSFR